MNKVSKDLDVMIIGAAIVDLPLRPVSKEVFDVVSYPVDGIAMTIGGDALNESTIITRLGHKVALMSCIGVDVAGAFVLSHCERTGIDTKYIKQDPAIDTSINVGLVAADVSRIEVFDEPAWRGGDRLSVTIAGEGIREGAVFFCAGDGHIEQTSFFFNFPFTVFTHGRRKEVFFYSNNENLFELQSFRCMDRHQGYFVLLGFIAVVLICRQRNFG